MINYLFIECGYPLESPRQRDNEVTVFLVQNGVFAVDLNQTVVQSPPGNMPGILDNNNHSVRTPSGESGRLALALQQQ